MTYYPNNPNGQATMANSSPVVVASDQSAVPVSGTVTANIGTVATLATAAKQDTGNTSVASIDTKTPALGQALAAASVPVVLTAAQVSTLTPPAAITGFALETTLGSVKTAVETLDNAISGNEMQVDVITMPTVQVQSNSANLATQTTAAAIQTSVELIDDTVATTASAIPTKGIAISGTDGTNARVLKTDTSGELQVDVLTMPTVTVTATNLDVQSGGADLATSTQAGAIQTAVELLDDTVKVLGTDTYTETSSKGVVMGAVRRDADTTLVNTTNEFTPLQVDANGRLKVEAFSGETLPVSLTSTTVTGTVAVTQSGTWDEVGINDSGNSITVDNGGTFVTQENGAALTSLQLIDDGIATTGSAITAKGMAAAGTDGTNARILKTDSSGELQVDVLTLPALAAGTNAIGKLAANSGVDIGDVDVTSVIAGTGATNLGKAEDAAHTTGDTGVAVLERRIDTAATSADTSGDYATANQSAEGASWATLTPTTTSGLSVANFTSGDTYTALTNSAQVIKASAGNLYGYYIYNPNATAAYVMVYNIAAASVTVGTSTPLLVFAIPATAAANLMFPYPITFSNAGWSCAAATTGGGNTAPSTALECMFWFK